jgi:hypothetical protein
MGGWNTTSTILNGEQIFPTSLKVHKYYWTERDVVLAESSPTSEKKDPGDDMYMCQRSDLTTRVEAGPDKTFDSQEKSRSRTKSGEKDNE